MNEYKIIIMLRNPIERAYSGYQHNRRYNMSENLSFEDAMNQAEIRYQEQDEMTPATRYLQLGLYHNQVKAFQENFKNVHIILYDDYVSDINTCFEKLFDFLNVKKIIVNSSKKHMTGGWIWRNNFMKKILVSKNNFKSVIKFLIPIPSLRARIRKVSTQLSTQNSKSININTKRKLIKFYREDINKLSSLLSRDLSHWLVDK